MRLIYDIAVIGGGHAGCEAAVAAARLDASVLLLTQNLDTIANMPCNPSIGGNSKGHLVREIDALGGVMGKVADATSVESRMLNKSKGPAVHSLRVQSDRRAYQSTMKHLLEQIPNLYIKQAEVTDILTENGSVSGVVTHTGIRYAVKAAIVATGTFLRGRIIVGDNCYDSGPDGLFPASRLSQSLASLGVNLQRFKTGTPPRVNRHTLDFAKLEEQPREHDGTCFSYDKSHYSTNPHKDALHCYITYTTQQTHDIILGNLDKAPMYSGIIEGVGPRYCPCIEDKVVRFKDKERHQLFIEPMGLSTDEMYIGGLSTSMPEYLQEQIVHSIPGLENAHIMRYAYAIEYDCINPLELRPSLEFKAVANLFGAGQFNGTSGYEEAAAAGLIAGINAARALSQKPPLILKRTDAYIGVLIDDLTSRGTNEPYRMMTARCEHRLLLRMDNSDARLTQIGYDIGLVDERSYEAFKQKQSDIEVLLKLLESTILPPSENVNEILQKHNSAAIITGIRLRELLQRPEINMTIIRELHPIDCAVEVAHSAEVRIKYQGYIDKQQKMVDKLNKHEGKRIPPGLDYSALTGLRIEAAQKLSAIRPETIGQAARISGVNPADIAILLLHI